MRLGGAKPHPNQSNGLHLHLLPMDRAKNPPPLRKWGTRGCTQQSQVCTQQSQVCTYYSSSALLSSVLANLLFSRCPRQPSFKCEVPSVTSPPPFHLPMSGASLCLRFQSFISLAFLTLVFLSYLSIYILQPPLQLTLEKSHTTWKWAPCRPMTADAGPRGLLFNPSAYLHHPFIPSPVTQTKIQYAQSQMCLNFPVIRTKFLPCFLSFCCGLFYFV